jgi:hypothetical protein
MSLDRDRKPGSLSRVGAVQRSVPDAGRRARTDSLDAPRSAFPEVASEQTVSPPVGDVHPEDEWLLLPSTRDALVQRRATEAASEATVHDAAAAGVATPAQALPYQGPLEESFGQDLSGVRAHVGGEAEVAASAMGAEAFATGDHVVLPASPSLHLVAHETAHVLQQRKGVHLKGGVGEAGDEHEQEADAAADAVVRGERASRSGAVPALPTGFEETITGTLEIDVAAGDGKAARTRVTLLGAQFRALHRPHRQALLVRLEHPRKGDALAALFQYKLATAERARLFAVLRDETPAATEEAADAEPEPGTEKAASVPAAPDDEAVLQSSDPAINGRPVVEVGAELRDKAASYARFPAQQQEYASYNLRNERRVLAEHDGVLGDVINLFNGADAPNPDRWHKAVGDWGVVQTQLQTVLAMVPSASSINTMGELVENGLRGWEAAMAETSRYSNEFLQYLEGFSQAARNVHTGVELTSEIAMAGAIACAVVLTGPAIAVLGGKLAGAVGATGAAAAAVKGTVVLAGSGLVGAGFKGGTYTGAQVAVEAGEMAYDMAARGKDLRAAADGFDWGAVYDKGTSGLKTGFIDGVIAQGGIALEAVAGRYIGKAFARYLGPYAGRIYAQVLRKAAERAIAAGVAGGVVGGLDAGTRAAVDGRSLPEILDAIEKGALLGLGLGTVLGGGFGVYSEARAARASHLGGGESGALTPSAPEVSPASVPDVPARPRSAAAPDIERLDPGRFQPVEGSLSGSMEKTRLVDQATGKEYLFKPNVPDAPLPDRALERGITPDSIADRAKASDVLGKHLDIDTPDVRLVEHEGRVGSLQEWRRGERKVSLQDLRSESPELYERVVASPEYQRLRRQRRHVRLCHQQP